MIHRFKSAMCAAVAAVLLTGCASEGTSRSDNGSSIKIVDIGSAGITAEAESQPVSDTTSVAAAEHVTTAAAETDFTEQSAPAASEKTTVSTTKKPVEVILPEETEENSEPQRQPEAADLTEEPAPPETEEAPTETMAQTTTSKPVEDTHPVEIGTSAYNALNHAEVQGIWISYLEFVSLLQGQSESGFRANISAAFDNCTALGLNTVYIHVRSHSDAYYNSVLFPWSKYVTGTLNKAPDFDPLEIVIEEAHSRNISVQAWINPLRACSASDMSSYGDYPVSDWLGGEKQLVKVNGYYYLNPAYSEVIDLISKGAAEIVANYDVDGLHIDDYFYPTTDSSFDSAAFAESGYSSLSDFRFANCDKLVKSIYTSVKAANPTAVFSVSVQGSIENNYNLMYADVKKWCSESGYLDMIIPQIYYGFDNSTQPYIQCLSEWQSLADKGKIPLVVGLSASKIGLEDKWAGAGKSEWINDSAILSRQLTEAMKCTRYGGAVLYSYNSVFAPSAEVKSKIEKEIEAYKNLIIMSNE